MMESFQTHTMFTRQIERHDDKILTINQYGVGEEGCVVWDAALVLAFYLESADFTDAAGCSLLTGRSVVELGSGTGVVGLQAAACGADCVVTDLEEFVPLMQSNIDTNRHLLTGSIRAETLRWGEPMKQRFVCPDYILLADCIYYEASVEPLFETVCELADAHTVVLCCYEQRHAGDKPEIERRFKQLFASKFNIDAVPSDRQHPVFHSDDILLLRMTKKLS